MISLSESQISAFAPFKCGPKRYKREKKTMTTTKYNRTFQIANFMNNAQSEFDEPILMVYKYWPRALG